MDDKTPLYPDFTLTRHNCHEEPIHRPVAIQGHGHMLVIENTSPPRLHAVSSSVIKLMQCDEASIWSKPLPQWLPEAVSQLISAHAPQGDLKPVVLAEQAIRWSSPTSEQYDLIVHCNAGFFIVEFEPLATLQISDGILARMARSIANSQNHEDLYANITRQIASAYQFDRVMVYQFDEDKHGCVVGEAKHPDLEPYLGLHYPESDIPKIARELFLKVKSRLISDIKGTNTTLIFSPTLGPNPPHLDLSFSQLRAISPIHIEYLSNMKITATLTTSIIINGDLWGLIACHHSQPLHIAFDHRVLSETIGDLLAKRILELEISAKDIQQAKYVAVENAFLENVRHSENYRINILDNASVIMDMCEAEGAALVTLDDCLFSSGLVPDMATLLNFREWLMEQGHTEVFETSSVDSVFPLNSSTDNNIGGVLAVCISLISHSYIFWFRPLVTKNTQWAGDPENSFSVTSADGDNTFKVNPRQSFEKWQVAVKGQSESWEANTLEMARRLRSGIFRKELVFSAELVKRTGDDFMQLAFAAAHDLQEPLRTQANYLELIEETLGLDQAADVAQYLKETTSTGTRMRNLITDLLNYASLNDKTQREDLSLTELGEELLKDLSSVIDTSKAVITFEELPTMRADRSRMKQLLQNLLTNAIKYVAEGTTPVISVFMKQEGSFSLLCVKDNGIGIDPADHEIVFKMFQRLHRKTDYEGTGIGLANSKKAAESMDATLGLDSVEGEGSVFWLKFHNSMIVT